MSEEENYEVDDIVNHRFRKGKAEYLIRWKNYTADDDTWEPEANLDCPDKIKLYKQKVFRSFYKVFHSFLAKRKAGRGAGKK